MRGREARAGSRIHNGDQWAMERAMQRLDGDEGKNVDETGASVMMTFGLHLLQCFLDLTVMSHDGESNSLCRELGVGTWARARETVRLS